MKKIWALIENKDWSAAAKYRLALLIYGILFALVGLLAWLIIRNWILSTWDWMVCFIGYPIFISFLFVFFYSCRHGFHDRAHSF